MEDTGFLTNAQNKLMKEVQGDNYATPTEDDERGKARGHK
jgi:hypothetical protein